MWCKSTSSLVIPTWVSFSRWEYIWKKNWNVQLAKNSDQNKILFRHCLQIIRMHIKLKEWKLIRKTHFKVLFRSAFSPGFTICSLDCPMRYHQNMFSFICKSVQNLSNGVTYLHNWYIISSSERIGYDIMQQFTPLIFIFLHLLNGTWHWETGGAAGMAERQSIYNNQASILLQKKTASLPISN